MLPGSNRTEQQTPEKDALPVLAELDLSRAEVLRDYRMAWESRHASLIGRREVMSGKAKFGIFGDGKELPQIALAKVFRQGDFRSGYYRDQTLLLAVGATTLKAFFAQLYAHADSAAEPASAGRQMNAHFSTALLDESGSWLDHTTRINSSGDLSPPAPRCRVSWVWPRLLPFTVACTARRLKWPGSQRMDAKSRSGQLETPAVPKVCSGSRSTQSVS
jgi:hypothetical protein